MVFFAGWVTEKACLNLTAQSFYSHSPFSCEVTKFSCLYVLGLHYAMSLLNDAMAI